MKGHLSFLSENGLGAILIVNIVIAGSLGSDAPLKALQKSAGGRGRGGGLVAGRRLLYTPPLPLTSPLLYFPSIIKHPDGWLQLTMGFKSKIAFNVLKFSFFVCSVISILWRQTGQNSGVLTDSWGQTS